MPKILSPIILALALGAATVTLAACDNGDDQAQKSQTAPTTTAPANGAEEGKSTGTGTNAPDNGMTGSDSTAPANGETGPDNTTPDNGETGTSGQPEGAMTGTADSEQQPAGADTQPAPKPQQ